MMKIRYQLFFSSYGGFGKVRWYLLMMVITSLSGWLVGQQLALAAVLTTTIPGHHGWSERELNQASAQLLLATTIVGIICWGLARYLKSRA
ncbi:hypothetical protein EUZ87_07480 [Lactiplantibacillus paraplantarum]|uniref:Uncharacterized protein n=1 Tax=Lactiplantibacillus paraplantarum TaxID=60520 RepID=A0A4V2L1S0_9LACO|nr:hypothetical protein EUZ87_07480 [Lactiplantibacillus paraplantarum]